MKKPDRAPRTRIPRPPKPDTAGGEGKMDAWRDAPKEKVTARGARDEKRAGADTRGKKGAAGAGGQKTFGKSADERGPRKGGKDFGKSDARRGDARDGGGKRPFTRDARDAERPRPGRDGGEGKPFKSRDDRSDTRGERPFRKNADRPAGTRPARENDRDERGRDDRSFRKTDGPARGGQKREFGGDERKGNSRDAGGRPTRTFGARSEAGGAKSFDRKPPRRDDERSGGKRADGGRAARPAARSEKGDAKSYDHKPRREGDERPPRGKSSFPAKQHGPAAKSAPRPPRATRRDNDDDHDEPTPKQQSTPAAAGTPMTLNKYLAHAGLSSRRDAAAVIKEGKVRVNGEVLTTPGYRVQPGDKVVFEGKAMKPEAKKAYVLLNKPKGFITTTDDEMDRRTVMELVQAVEAERLYPVGRLDRNTTGLLLMTNDGDLAQRLTHPKYEAKKIYQVGLDKPLTKADFEKLLTTGVELEDGIAKPDKLSFLEDPSELGIEIHSGRNRIVRRMFEALGYEVEKLDRVMFAGLTKKNIPRGQWRHLTEQEIVRLKHFKM